MLRGDDVKPAAGGYSVGNLNLTVGGEIHATKAAGEGPMVVGNIRTIRGFYEFQGRRFDLERDGTVSFKGRTPPIRPSTSLVSATSRACRRGFASTEPPRIPNSI